MVWLLNSQGMKNSKSTESFCVSILTIYTNDWCPFWHVYCCHVYFFFCEIPKYVQAKSKLVHLDWHFMEWASWIWWIQSGLVPSHQKFSSKWNLAFSRLSHQRGSLFTWADHSMQSAPFSATFAFSRMPFCIKCWS